MLLSNNRCYLLSSRFKQRSFTLQEARSNDFMVSSFKFLKLFHNLLFNTNSIIKKVSQYIDLTLIRYKGAVCSLLSALEVSAML